MNLPAVDLSVAATIFASVAVLQAFYQARRVMKRHPNQGRPLSARRLALMFLLSCVTLLALPALAGMFLSQPGASQIAAAPGPTKDQPSSRDAAVSPSSSAIDAGSMQESVTSLPAASAPSQPPAPIAPSRFRGKAPAGKAPAPATEAPEARSQHSKVDEVGPAETDPQSDESRSEETETGSQPEEEEQPEGLLQDGGVDLPLDPGLPPVGR